MVTVAAFGQRTVSIPEANIQNAVTYVDRGLAKQKKNDLDGAMADFNHAINSIRIIQPPTTAGE
jgi:hypothetical protein